MIALVSVPDLPRSTTRAQWREVQRWRRVTQRMVNEQMKAHQEEIRVMISELTVFGRVERMMLIDRVVNPPVIVYGRIQGRGTRLASMIDAALEGR